MITVGDISGATSEIVAQLLATRIGYPAGEQFIKTALDTLVPSGSGNPGLNELAQALNGLDPQTTLKFRRSEFYKTNVPKPSEHAASSQALPSSAVAQPVVVVQADPADSALALMGYTRIRLLGQGGFGRVFLVKDGSEKRYAVKQAGSSQEAEAEAKVMAALNHKSIPKVVRRKDAFIAVEFVVGREVKSLIPTSVGLACEVAAAVGETVAYMHRTGYTHGDIKPANVMISNTKGYVLIDFGEAKDATASRVAADVRMLGNLVRRCILGNETDASAPWPRHVQPALAELVDQARAEQPAVALSAFLFKLTALAPAAREYEGVIDDHVALYGSASGLSDEEIDATVERRLNPGKPPSGVG